MIPNFKEKIAGITGSVSGVTSLLGSWQVCHNVCLGLVTLLSLVGITVAGMPLFFLTKLAKPLWMVAFILLLITLGFYFLKKCISPRLVLFNTGLLVAGVPFTSLQRFSVSFWVIGGIIAATAIGLYIKDKVYDQIKKQEGRG